MTNKAIMLTLRLEPALKSALDDKARQRRIATGENVAIADLVREALGLYLSGSSQESSKTDIPKATKKEPLYKTIQAEAVRLRAEGLSQREIAERLGCAQSVVSKALKGG